MLVVLAAGIEQERYIVMIAVLMLTQRCMIIKQESVRLVLVKKNIALDTKEDAGGTKLNVVGRPPLLKMLPSSTETNRQSAYYHAPRFYCTECQVTVPEVDFDKDVMMCRHCYKKWFGIKV
jgi:hypothetical protein